MSESASIPRHIGFILDGNRRWATAQGLPTLEGHRRGAEVFREISLAAFDRGVEFVSGYIFSSENWSRTQEEVGYLMTLVLKAFETYLDKFHEQGIRILVLGERNDLDDKVLETVEQAEEKTAKNTKGTLGLCFGYGGKQEITHAVRRLIHQGITEKEVTPETIQEALYAPNIPDIDLLIRTGGEKRISNFMLWRAAYAELLFTDTLWPDFTIKDLDSTLLEYKQRNRRFGN